MIDQEILVDLPYFAKNILIDNIFVWHIDFVKNPLVVISHFTFEYFILYSFFFSPNHINNCSN